MAEAIANTHVLIIGAGAAGATCALYLGRAGIRTTVLDRDASTLRRAEVHNYPGNAPFVGQDWLNSVRTQASETGSVTFETTRVTAMSRQGEGFHVETRGGSYDGDYLVLATGQGPFDYGEALGIKVEDPVQPYVKTNIVIDKWGETSLPKAFACGVLAGWPSQTVICAGSGATVAIRIVSQLSGEFYVDHVTAPEGLVTAPPEEE